jgi:hypothetical protein
MPWNSMIGRPNWDRPRAYATASSSAACASPTEHAAMPSRPEFNADSAIRKPSPGAPSSRSAGTCASSNSIWVVGEPVRPILRSGGAAVRPGVAASTSRHEMPRPPSGAVRTIVV